MNISTQKKISAAKIAIEDHVRDGIVLGLGSGSTVEEMIKILAQKIEEQKINIKCVSTSRKTSSLATQLGIDTVSIDQVDRIDVSIDGTDEFETNSYNMIKGGGGCLLWERIIAKASDKMVVIFDDDKCVENLGNFPLPVEITPFGENITMQMIFQCLRNNHSYPTEIKKRKVKDSEDFVTDSGNYIVDVRFKGFINSPQNTEKELNTIPGVVENGLFCGVADEAYIGVVGDDGVYAIRHRQIHQLGTQKQILGAAKKSS